MNFLRASIRQVMGCIILVTALAAQSQEFPSKPIRIISPFSAGSSTDLIARVIGQKITENTGQQVIVDTRPGANGIIGVDLAAKAAPDGYTIVLASNGTHGINVSLFNKLPYDPVKDFAPVTQVGHVAYLLLRRTARRLTPSRIWWPPPRPIPAGTHSARRPAWRN